MTVILDISFDRERDKMIIVFDADIFEEKVQDYDEVVALGEAENILAVSNPAFELFLLLHFENAYEEKILSRMKRRLLKMRKTVIRHSFINCC